MPCPRRATAFLLGAVLSAQRPPFWAGAAEGHQVQWSAADLKILRGQSVVFSARRDFLKEAPGERVDRWRLRSLVGPVLSVEVERGGTRTLRTFRLAPGLPPAHLQDLFPEADLLGALLRDPTLRRALGEHPAPTSLRELTKRLRSAGPDAGAELPPDWLDRFAFHRVEGDRVVVRLDRPGGLELLLPIPEALEEPLARARSGRGGLLMGDLARRVGPRAQTELRREPRGRP